MMLISQLLLSCIALFGITSVVPLAEEKGTNSLVEFDPSNENVCHECNDGNPTIHCCDNERELTSEYEEFIFYSNTKINNVESEGSCNLYSFFSIDPNTICCIVTNIMDLGNIQLKFYQESEYISSYNLFFALSADGIYYSSGRTLDCAKYLAGQDLGYTFGHQVLVDDDAVSYASNKVSGKVSGYFNWTDEEKIVHPIVGASVELCLNGAKSSAKMETTTNNSGYYSFSYTDVSVGSKDGLPEVSLYLENDYISVINSDVYSKSWSATASSSSYTISYIFSSNDDMGCAASIFQAAQCFSTVAASMDTNSKLKSCKIKYPASSDNCNYSNNKIKILYSAGAEGCPASYYAWDVIGHEYGHHIQNCFGFLNGPNNNHSSSNNDIDYLYEYENESLKNAKKNGIKLSFQEAWPTFWSIVAQSSFSSKWKLVNFVGDSYYTSYNGLNYNLDAYSDSYPNLGDAQERSIMRILYKLWSSTTDDYDKFTIGFDKLFSIMCTYQPLTFSEFANALYDEGYNKNNLGLLFGQYNVVPNTMYVDGGKFTTSVCPTFVWSTYMGSKYLYFNEFTFILQASDGTQFVKANITTTSTTTCSYTLTNSEWLKVRSYGDENLDAYLIAWQTDYVTTGGYYTQMFRFVNTTAYSLLENYDYEKEI